MSDAQEFGELHRYVLVVAQNAKGRKQWLRLILPTLAEATYRPILDVDDCIVIDHIHGRYVPQLVEGQFSANRWENTYLMLDEG